MEWTDIRLTVAQKDAEQAEAAATMIAEGGIYIEDYSDIEQQVAEIAHVDLIEPELLEKPRDVVIIHIYLEPGTQPAETLAAIDARMDAAGIPYTVETAGVEQEDWQNGWRKYYHPLEIGRRLAVVPSWQEYDTDRIKLRLDPGRRTTVTLIFLREAFGYKEPVFPADMLVAFMKQKLDAEPVELEM